MTDVDTRFTEAAQAAQNLSRRPDNAQLLQLYALYKQATAGDVSGEQPGFTDFVGRAKYDAWANLKGTPQDQAKQQYIALVEELQAA